LNEAARPTAVRPSSIRYRFRSASLHSRYDPGCVSVQRRFPSLIKWGPKHSTVQRRFPVLIKRGRGTAHASCPHLLLRFHEVYPILHLILVDSHPHRPSRLPPRATRSYAPRSQALRAAHTDRRPRALLPLHAVPRPYHLTHYIDISEAIKVPNLQHLVRACVNAYVCVRARACVCVCAADARLPPFHSVSPSRMEQGMRSRPRLHRSGDPATNPHSGIRNSLPTLAPSAQAAAPRFSVPPDSRV
jgi:hypothetical protein